MPTAKQNFLERIDHLQKSLSVDTLNDRPPSETQHNNIAKILRNGLAVVGFVSLEDFIKKRTGEILQEIGRTSVAFSSLPEKLRYSVTVDALNALIRVVKNEETTEDEISLIQSESSKISSTANTTYDLTEYAFGFKYSNLNEAEIKHILKCFIINDGWGKMSAISSRLGLTSFPLDVSFKNAAIRRHSAAHVAHSNTPINDLRQFINEAIGIAIGFDSLLTKALSFIKTHNRAYLSGSLTIDHSLIKFSYIKLESGVWKYKREGMTRSIRNDSDKLNLISSVFSTVQSNSESLVIYNDTNNIIDWYCH